MFSRHFQFQINIFQFTQWQSLNIDVDKQHILLIKITDVFSMNHKLFNYL